METFGPGAEGLSLGCFVQGIYVVNSFLELKKKTAISTRRAGRRFCAESPLGTSSRGALRTSLENSINTTQNRNSRKNRNN